jgi:hypothetical protein|tara:strand:- start:458 stop:649 length:192 start_codon:yes stop_codon:yes gene_type:complete
MTVQQLIEKLQSLNPHDEVVIEVNHDDIVPLKEDRIVEDFMTQDHRLTTQEDVEARKVITLRA